MPPAELGKKLAEEGELCEAALEEESLKEREGIWADYAFDRPRNQPLPSLAASAINSFVRPGLVVDLGCGNSPTVDTLLQKGWKVIAVDSNASALRNLQRRIQQSFPDKMGNLQIVESTIEAFKFPTNVQLILAMDSLPYADPKKLVDIWDRAHSSLVTGGRIAGTFFTYHYCTCLTSRERKHKGSFYINISMMKALLQRHAYKTETYGHEIPLHEHILSLQPRKINFIAQKTEEDPLS